MILLLLAQVVTPVPPPPERTANGGERWSILEPVCRSEGSDDIVVCAPGVGQRLPDLAPLPGDIPPARARQPLNEPRAALDPANTGRPCAEAGCQVGFGPDVIAVARLVADEVRHRARRRHPGERVAIPLD